MFGGRLVSTDVLEHIAKLTLKVLAALVGLALLTACASSTSPALTSAGDWPMFRGDLLRDGHPASAALTADQAAHLKLAWTRPLDGAIDGSERVDLIIWPPDHATRRRDRSCHSLTSNTEVTEITERNPDVLPRRTRWLDGHCPASIGTAVTGAGY